MYLLWREGQAAASQQVRDQLRLLEAHTEWLEARIREGVADVMVPLYTGKRRRKPRRPGQPRPQGATGAELEAALDRWASKYPERIH